MATPEEICWARIGPPYEYDLPIPGLTDDEKAMIDAEVDKILSSAASDDFVVHRTFALRRNIMPYSFPLDHFPTLIEVKDALPLVRDLYLDASSVPSRDVKLAVINVGACVLGMTESDEPPIFGATSATKKEVEAAFNEAIAAANAPAMSSTPMGSAWLTILAPIILEMVRKWLSR